MAQHRAGKARRSDRAHGPRPAQLVMPQAGEGRLGYPGLDDIARQHDREALLARRVPDPAVVGELVAQSREPADAPEGLAPQRDRRTEAAMADAHGRGHQRAGKKAEIDVQRTELGPEAPSRNALVKAGDEAGAGIVQRRGDSAEIAP